ncbi:MAG TPA: rhodanese-like domain-containing protein [Opitutaceae bacterium]|nr:rhodanese-like domain-containing protein [Opitutaceae bacterium]
MKKLSLLLSSLLFAAAMKAAPVPNVTPSEAAKLVAEGKAVLVDVREPKEWKDTGVATPATLLAKSDFDGAQASWKPFLETHRDKTLILYCRSGKRSGAVAKELAEKGYNVANAGGFEAWKSAGLPTRAAEEPAPAASAASNKL